MFESAVAFAKRSNEKDVARHRCRLTEKADLPFADAFEVGRQSLKVAIMATGNGYFMRHTAGREGGEREAAHFDRMVDQFVVVACLVHAKSVAFGRVLFPAHRFEGGGNLPAAIRLVVRCLDVDQAGGCFVAKRTEEDAGAVEKRMRLIKMRAAYRQIPGVNLTDDGEWCVCLEGGCAPGVLVGFAKTNGFATGFGADRNNMPCKIPNQVTAGNPRRQGELLARPVRRGNGASNFEKMRLGIGRADGVANCGSVFHRGGIDRGCWIVKRWERTATNIAAFLSTSVRKAERQRAPVSGFPTLFCNFRGCFARIIIWLIVLF